MPHHSNNRILSTVSAEDMAELQPHLRLVELEHGRVLAESRQRVHKVYFPHGGILSSVVELKAGGLGNLGNEQLEWLEDDLKGRSNSTPIVVFAHIPLWMVYEKWGWGTKDGEQALAMLKPFGSVTVLNGHIHQVVQKVEGNVAFHTAMATAFPQPAPGAAPNPGPMAVPAGKLASVLGVTKVKVVRGHNHLAVVDSTLAETV